MDTRSFIALPVPRSVSDFIIQSQGIFSSVMPDIRLVSHEHIHSTLIFLGILNNADREKINDIIKVVGEGMARFSLKLGDLLYFPDSSRTRVVTYSVLDPSAQFQALHSKLEKSLLTAGYRFENKPWLPHVTIGRFKDPMNMKDSLLSNETQKPNEWVVESFCLYESEFFDGGVRYRVLHEYVFPYAL